MRVRVREKGGWMMREMMPGAIVVQQAGGWGRMIYGDGQPQWQQRPTGAQQAMLGAQ